MKKFSFIVVTLASMLFAFNVKATADSDCITGAGSQTCVLSDDLVVTEQLIVQGQVDLDLNGHTISVPDNIQITSGVIGVRRGASLTIRDSGTTGKISSGALTYAAVALTIPGESATGSKATLIVEGGTLEGRYYAIVGNGNRHNTSITINGGTLRGLEVNDNVGIYHPQEGTLIINGGTISGATGIEIRSGSLTVNGGTIEGTGSPVSVTPNGNGTTTVGAGIAIAQHTSVKDIDVKIKGGTISGFSAVYESNPQNNANVTDQVSLVITGGNFQAINEGTVSVYSEDLEDFIVRGTFNTALDEDYINDESDIKESNGSYIIGSEHYTEIDDESNDSTGTDVNTSYDSAAYVSSVETYDVNISWDDLHWVFVYEGDVTNPVRSVWVTKEYYDTVGVEKQHLSVNELNGDILDNTPNLAEPKLGIVVENNSVFAVDLTATVESVSNTNYTNPAGLQVAIESTTTSAYASEASTTNLTTGNTVNVLVKPTATRFVNDTGATANVTGEVALTISKSV